MWVVGATQEIDHASRWRDITAICFTTTILMTSIVTTRLCIRRAALFSEDWVILVTAVAGIVFSAATIAQTRYGLGLPLDQRIWPELVHFMTANYIAWPCYVLSIGGFKIALCLSYLRLTGRTMNRTYRTMILSVTAASSLCTTSFVILALFSCMPLRKMLNPFLPGRCLPWGPILYANAGINILSDVVVFLLPLPLIRHLHLRRPVKLGLMFVFSLGLLTCLCSVLRATQIWETAYGSSNSSLLAEYSAIEINVGIITACLPVLRPVTQRLLDVLTGWKKTTSRSRRSQQTATGSRDMASAARGGQKVDVVVAGHTDPRPLRVLRTVDIVVSSEPGVGADPGDKV